jgi:RNase P/RNase MRP subunit POP5
MKPLKPSIRERKRYFLIKFDNIDIKKSIEDAIFDFIGILGLSKVGLRYIEINKNFAIISINREMVNYVKSAFCLYPKEIIVEKISGTLKSLKSKKPKNLKTY